MCSIVPVSGSPHLAGTLIQRGHAEYGHLSGNVLNMNRTLSAAFRDLDPGDKFPVREWGDTSPDPARILYRVPERHQQQFDQLEVKRRGKATRRGSESRINGALVICDIPLLHGYSAVIVCEEAGDLTIYHTEFKRHSNEPTAPASCRSPPLIHVSI